MVARIRPLTFSILLLYHCSLGHAEIRYTEPAENIMSLLGCALIFVNCYQKNIQFDHYLSVFQNYYGRTIDKLTIDWGDLGRDYNAYCFSEHSLVRLNVRRFNLLDATTQEQVVMHELG